MGTESTCSSINTKASYVYKHFDFIDTLAGNEDQLFACWVHFHDFVVVSKLFFQKLSFQ